MKYYIKNTREEVKIGSRISQTSVEKTPYGECKKTCIFTVTGENLPLLLKDGVIVKEETSEVPTAIEFYIEKLARKLSMDSNKVTDFITSLNTTHTSIVFSLFLKEIAITMDRKYPDHISACKEFFYVSLVDGKIHVTTTPPANFSCISLFRTHADAAKALYILRGIHKELFPSLYVTRKQKD